jgi:RNA polymerase sigma factor (sigma-70 family)
MDADTTLAHRFEAQRPHLRAVAYRMLGSSAEADDAVQETWLRASRAGAEDVDNLDGWLTTIVSRVCLNALRARRTRREDPLDDVRVPDPVVSPLDGGDPEHEAVLADSVGLALLVVLETLGPAERIAFVLHDLFAVPFDEIAAMLDRSPAATRQLASRARRRVRGAAPAGDADRGRQRALVEAFLAATREGDMQALLAVLDPDVVLRADQGGAAGPPSRVVHGVERVTSEALGFARLMGRDLESRLALVGDGVGVVSFRGGVPFSVLGFAVRDGRIAEIDILADPERVARLDLRGV